VIILAYRGKQYLLAETQFAEKGQVLDLDQNRLFPLFPVQAILARGYWIKYNGTPDEEQAIVLQAATVRRVITPLKEQM
jgi:hypothetical protein